MKLIIEKGTLADLEEMEQFYYDVLDSLQQGINYPGWKKGVYPTEKDAAHGIENNNLFIARDGNKIAGSIILNHNTEKGYDTAPWSIPASKDEVYAIHTLAVHPNYVNLGVGRQLLEFAENYSRDNQAKALRLDVYEHNCPAIRLYEKCGYQFVARVDLGYSAYGLDWFLLFEKVL